MKNISFIIGLSVLALQSCTDNLMYTEPGNEAILTGNTYQAAFIENSSAHSLTALAPGSQILLNASGSLQASNQILTYTNDRWQTENGMDWTDQLEKTSITALYPAYSDFAYTEEKLYQNHSLEDVLYVKSDYPAGEHIHLEFKHLFSLLTLHLSEELQNDFRQIEVTCPVTVADIQPESADITLTDQTSHTTSIAQASASGSYSFIVPPAENITLSVHIRTNGKEYTTQLKSKSFSSNQEYAYHLKTSENTPGIVTAEDWIAFSQLINSKTLTTYKGKTLADFGKTVDGVTTYYLLNDIDFTGVDCKNLKPIKDRYSKFQDVFDGKGHTISHLTPKAAYGVTGLFGWIDTNGTIKNLHLKSCKATITEDCGTGTALLAGACYGTISNCSIEGCTLSTEKSTPMGGLVGALYGGTLINCSVQQTKLSSIISAGGIVGYSYGKIINCFSSNNTIEGRDNSGGISGKADNGKPTILANCYVHSNRFSFAESGLFLGVATHATLTGCFYSSASSWPLIGGGTGSKDNVTSENMPYTAAFTDAEDTPVYQLLNRWIDETAPTLYPEHTFTRWTDGGESLPAVFVHKK